jgi:putative Mg2+ transporter-C (MgtC) family protein
LLAFICGIVIGGERELKKKPAGVSTQTLVIGAATLFTYLSKSIYPEDPTRIAAQIVTGVGFLGAGIILKSENKVTNLTTAASVWYSAAIGMALGFNQHLLALVATIYAVVISRIPKISKEE